GGIATPIEALSGRMPTREIVAHVCWASFWTSSWKLVASSWSCGYALVEFNFRQCLCGLLRLLRMLAQFSKSASICANQRQRFGFSHWFHGLRSLQGALHDEIRVVDGAVDPAAALEQLRYLAIIQLHAENAVHALSAQNRGHAEGDLSHSVLAQKHSGNREHGFFIVQYRLCHARQRGGDGVVGRAFALYHCRS